MNREVTIRIKGVQKYPNGEKAETITEANAEYFERNGSRYVKYEEEADGFTQSSNCLLKVRTDYVEMTKKGFIQSNMTFEKGKCHKTDYRTPFGVVMLGVKTQNLQIAEEENKLEIQMEYVLEAEEEHMADCKIQIRVESK